MLRPALVLTLSLFSFSAAGAAVLDVPKASGKYSGISFASGWKCPPNGNITVSFDGGAPIPAATQLSRGDTADECVNDGRNGYIIQFNYNLLGDGPHTASVRQNGVEFASAVFNVVTFGQEFMTGVSKSYELPNFPSSGSSASIEWDQGSQNFQITGRQGSITPPTGGLAGLIGTWRFQFTIISTFDETYRLQRVENLSLGYPGLRGLDSFGDPVLVAKVQDIQPGSEIPYEFFLLDPTIAGCDAFFFDRTSAERVDGRYFLLLGNECDTVLGDGYPMIGTRLSTTASLDAQGSSALAAMRSELRELESEVAVQEASESASALPADLSEAITGVVRAARDGLR